MGTDIQANLISNVTISEFEEKIDLSHRGYEWNPPMENLGKLSANCGLFSPWLSSVQNQLFGCISPRLNVTSLEFSDMDFIKL